MCPSAREHWRSYKALGFVSCSWRAIGHRYTRRGLAPRSFDLRGYHPRAWSRRSFAGESGLDQGSVDVGESGCSCGLEIDKSEVLTGFGSANLVTVEEGGKVFDGWFRGPMSSGLRGIGDEFRVKARELFVEK